MKQYENEKIFINIASFRDPSLPLTIKSALITADNPENLVFALGMQYYTDEIPDLSFIESSQLKTIYWDPDNRPGVIGVRHAVSNLMSDEKYFLMSDSHMIFKKSWDTKLKSDLKDLESRSANKVIISGCGSKDDQPHYHTNNYSIQSNFSINSKKNKRVEKHGPYTRDYHMDCSHFFCDSNFIRYVGLDPYSNFIQEELYLSWKAFVSGWDVYVPYGILAEQNPHWYFNIVWGGDRESRTYTNKKDLKENEIELMLAMMHNLGKYSVSNPSRSPRDFWHFVGAGDIYDSTTGDSGMYSIGEFYSKINSLS